MTNSNEGPHPHSLADEIAEQNALQSAANGDWEKFARDGFEESAGQIAVEASASLTPKELPKNISSQPGFDQAESGLLVPKSDRKVDVSENKVTNENDVVVRDKRRWTPESVEAEDQARIEKLREPLTNSELLKVSEIASKALGDVYRKEGKKHEDTKVTRQVVDDIRGDIVAFGRLKQIAEGKAIARGNDEVNVYHGMSPRDRINDLVATFSSLTAEIPHIGSMGGSVQIDPNTHIVHHEGYNNGLLYNFARLSQIYDKLESDPMRARKVLESEQPDFAWLTSDPVTVDVHEFASA